MKRRDFLGLAIAVIIPPAPPANCGRLQQFRVAFDLAYGPDLTAMIEYRAFLQAEVCRIYQIPPHLIRFDAQR
jgi:hypothetical protein